MTLRSSGHEAFAAVPASVGMARQTVATTLRGLPREVVADVVLMVSELATNAVVHGGTGYGLSVEYDGPVDRIRVSVSDRGPGAPRRASAAPTDTRGRGLRIVARLASRWGIDTQGARVGKTVWFEVPASARGGTAGDGAGRAAAFREPPSPDAWPRGSSRS